MAKRLIPSFNRILVEKIVPPSKTNAGILLPEKTTKVAIAALHLRLHNPLLSSSLKLLNSGRVVAVGPGSRDRDGKHIPIAVKEGDVVLLPEYGGTEVKLGDKEYVNAIC
ncbi:10 kDa chaperonin [Platanthera guangdongensis]|uniref:10 kDa chaperonin n=1 Tax=Platanthera guangdongensis TaxID=2320717 RepID=A0ABR2M7B4_9ASPA